MNLEALDPEAGAEWKHGWWTDPRLKMAQVGGRNRWSRNDGELDAPVVRSGGTLVGLSRNGGKLDAPMSGSGGMLDWLGSRNTGKPDAPIVKSGRRLDGLS